MRQLNPQELQQVYGGTTSEGLKGYEGQPGNQGGHNNNNNNNNPQSANPEVPAGATPQPN